MGRRATELRLRAQAAVVDAEHGPKAMEATEIAVLRDRETFFGARVNLDFLKLRTPRFLRRSTCFSTCECAFLINDYVA